MVFELECKKKEFNMRILKSDFKYNSDCAVVEPKTIGVDPAMIGVPNICFSLIKKTDSRFAETAQQRIERGFDDSETWSLTDTIANFISPRLKRYQEIAEKAIVQSPEEKANILAFTDMLDLVRRDEGAMTFTDDEKNRVKAGLESFQHIFLGLWW